MLIGLASKSVSQRLVLLVGYLRVAGDNLIDADDASGESLIAVAW